MNPGELLTQKAFAERRGVGKSAVSNWKARGLLVMVAGENGKDLVDVAATEANLDLEIDTTRGRPISAPAKQAASGAGGEMGAVRLELIKAQTARRLLENDVYAGKLVALAEFEAKAADWGRRARERIQGVMRQNAKRLATMTDARAVLALLNDEVDKAFASLADEADAEGEVAADLAAAEPPIALEG